MKGKQSWFDLARILAILGGLLTVVSGAQEILSLVTRRNIPGVDAFFYAALVIAMGLVAILGSRQVKIIVWDVVLIIVGLVAYQFDGGFPWIFGPILVVVAGIIGLVGKLS